MTADQRSEQLPDEASSGSLGQSAESVGTAVADQPASETGEGTWPSVEGEAASATAGTADAPAETSTPTDGTSGQTAAEADSSGSDAPTAEAAATTDDAAGPDTPAAEAIDEVGDGVLPATGDAEATGEAEAQEPPASADVEVVSQPASEPATSEAADAATVAQSDDATTASDSGASGDAEAADAPATEAAEAPATEAAAAPPAKRVPEGPEPTTMEELLNEQEGDIRSFKHGDVVEGTIVRIDKDEILVDIGAKSEGVVSNRELYGRHAENQPQLAMGDTVLVYVLQPESNEGHAVLSLRRAGLERKWRSMQEQFDAGIIIEAPVIDHNKGGLIVDCGIRGFVPISQIVDFPRRPQNEQPRDAAQEIAEKLQPYVGRKLRLKILEVNRKANRLILSEKVALYEERREKRDELFSSLQVGQKVTGTIRSIAPFGVFVDLGGIDGLVHKSELSWNKVNNPEAGYKVGEEVEAEVIDINHERGRISLSIRRLQPDPWESTVADFKVGDVIEGTVTKIVNFGAFVRVRDGLEGLIHISELSHQRVAHPGDVVHEGQRLQLKIISLDSERHRLGLSLKQAEEPPAAASAAREPRERRPRQERSYDPSQAIQEPEGGIDNTLAAAFAQVRQQVEASEAARDDTDETGVSPAEATGEPTEVAAEATEATGSGEDEPEAAAEPISDAVVAETLAAEPDLATAAVPETADAPALEVGPADGGGADSGDEAATAEVRAEPETAESAEDAEAAAGTESAESTEASAGTAEASEDAEASTEPAEGSTTEPAESPTKETPDESNAAEPTPDEAAVAGPDVDVSTATDDEGSAASFESESAAAATSDDAGLAEPKQERGSPDA